MAAKKKTSTKRPSEREKPPVAGERREHTMIDARAEREAVKGRGGKSSGVVRK